MNNKQKLKIFLVGFLTAIFLLGFWSVRSCVHYEKKKEAWEEEKRDLLVQAADAEIIANKALDGARAARVVADEHRERVIEITEKIVRTEAELENILGSVLELAPDAQVVRSRVLLGVEDSDIVLTRKGVLFSFDAMIKATQAFVHLDFTLKKTIPEYKFAILEQKEEINDLRKATDEYEISIKGYEEGITKWKKLYEGEFKLRIDAENKFSILSKKDVYIISGVAITVVGLILLLR